MSKADVFAPRQVAQVVEILEFLTSIFEPEPKRLCGCPPDFVVMWGSRSFVIESNPRERWRLAPRRTSR